MTTAPRTRPCPTCGASVRADATFCGQCYADFRPPPEPVPLEQAPVVAPPTAPAPSAAYSAPAPDPLTQPLLELFPLAPAVPAPAPVAEPVAEPPAAPVATWPCTTCGAANPLTEMACSACGAGFLAAVREEGRPQLVVPGVGDLMAMSRGKRLGLAAAALGALLVPLALITLLLTGSPPEATTPDGTTTTEITTP